MMKIRCNYTRGKVHILKVTLFDLGNIFFYLIQVNKLIRGWRRDKKGASSPDDLEKLAAT
jgi:hypothetical protein